MHQDCEPLPGICLALRSWWLDLPQHSSAKHVLLRPSAPQRSSWCGTGTTCRCLQHRNTEGELRAEGHPCSAVLGRKAPVTRTVAVPSPLPSRGVLEALCGAVFHRERWLSVSQPGRGQGSLLPCEAPLLPCST